MPSSIVIRAELNDTSIRQAAEGFKKTWGAALDELSRRADEIAKKISSVGQSRSGNTGAGGTGGAPSGPTEAEILRLAQAQARLQAASGQSAAAQQTLTNALAGVTKQTAQSISAQTQLVNLQNKAQASTQQAAVSALRLAQAQARLQAASGNLTGAQQTLQQALQGVNQNTSAAVSAQTQLASVQNRAEAQTRELADVTQNLGVTLTASLTAPLALAGREILKVGTDYEKSLNLFQASTKATAEQMRAAAIEARKLGADTTLPATSAADAAKAMTELAKAGLSAEQAISATRGTLQLAAAANVDEARAAEIAANALNAFNLRASEAGRVADLLAAAANASSAEINDVALAMQQSSATAATLKIPIQDLVTAIAAMANAGIKGSDAGTSLKTALINLNPKSKAAAEAMAELGFNAFNAEGRLKPLRQIIEEFTNATKNLTDQQRLQKVETIFGTDALRAALVVFGGGVEQFDKLSAAVNQQGAAADLAAARTKGLGGAWDAFKSQLETGALIVFDRLAPTLEGLVRKLTELAGSVFDTGAKFAEAHPNITLTAIAITAVAAAIGPLLVVLDTLAKSTLAIIEMTTALRGLVAVVGTAQTAGTVAGSLTLLNPIVLAITGVLIAGGIAWYEYSRRTSEAAATIEQSARRARGAVELLNGEKSKLITLGDGQTVNLIPGRETSIILPPGPRVSFGNQAGFVPIDPTAAATRTAVAAANATAARISNTSSSRGSGGSAEQTELQKLTEQLKGVNQELAILRNPDSPEFKLQRQIEAARAEVERLKDSLKGVKLPDLDSVLDKLREQSRDVSKALSFLVPPKNNGIPGGELPTPEVVKAAKQLNEIPPPPIIRELSEGERFAKGFTSAIETTGDAFERFGQNVSRSLLNVKDLFRNIGQSFKTLFLDLIGSGLQNLVGSTLGALFNRTGSGSNGNSGAGSGGFFSNILNGFGFGGGNNSSLLRTPSFNPNTSSTGASSSNNFFRQLSGLNFGITPPPSITGAPATVSGSASRVGQSAINQATGSAGLFGRIGGFTSSLFGGAGGALLPLLGFGLGTGIGGQSGLGQILGGLGAGAVGLGLSYGASVFGALGGGLGALGPAALAALGPIALIGAPLLVGALLLGKAKQRKKDEATSGDSLQKAVDAIHQLRRDVANDRIVGERNVRDTFTQEILQTFINETNALKTKSVRESRLRNQVPDLKNLFEKEVIPEVARQKLRQTVNSRLIPEFATGGLFQGEGLAKLHDGEVILNKMQQSRLFAMTSPSIFKSIGVPNAPTRYEGGVPAFASGGVMVTEGRAYRQGGDTSQPIVINLTYGKDFATGMLELAADSDDGRQIIVNTVRIDELRKK